MKAITANNIRVSKPDRGKANSFSQKVHAPSQAFWFYKLRLVSQKNKFFGFRYIQGVRRDIRPPSDRCTAALNTLKLTSRATRFRYSQAAPPYLPLPFPTEWLPKAMCPNTIPIVSQDDRLLRVSHDT